MSGPYHGSPRYFAWHGLTLTVPGGPLRMLMCIAPSELWTLFREANTPVHPKVFEEIKSCLTQIYLQYLEEAESLRLIVSGERVLRKEAWKQSDRWKFLERFSTDSSRARQAFYERKNWMLSEQNKVCWASVLTNGESHAPACSKGQHADPSTSYFAETHELLQKQLRQERLNSSAPTASANCHNLSSSHVSASAMVSSPLAPESSERTLSIDIGSKRRFSISYDSDDENGQNIDKKPKLEGYHGVEVGKLNDNVIINSRNFSSFASAVSKDPASTMGGFAGCRSEMNIPTNKSNGSDEKVLVLRQSEVSTSTSQNAPPRFNAVSSLTDLASEEDANHWLNYTLGSVLERHPPSIPTHASTLDAAQQAIPYLFSLKTRLVSLLYTTKDIADSDMGKWTREEIGRAIKDTQTAWDCLKMIPDQRNVSDKDMEDKRREVMA